MNKFHRFDIDWDNYTWAVFVEGKGRWDFTNQDEAHAFMQSVEAYNPDAEIYWELFKND